MSSLLRFDTYSGLRDGDAALARIEAGVSGAYAGISTEAGGAYDIVREGRRGWRFNLRARDGRAVGAFHPVRVGRGGTIRGEGVEVVFRPKPFTDVWQVRFPLRDPIEVRSTTRREHRREDGRVVTSIGSGLELALSAPGGVPGGADSLALLVFVCWLITEIRVTSSSSGGGGG
jgi:hypothetical protein